MTYSNFNVRFIEGGREHVITALAAGPASAVTAARNALFGSPAHATQRAYVTSAQLLPDLSDCHWQITEAGLDALDEDSFPLRTSDDGIARELMA